MAHLRRPFAGVLFAVLAAALLAGCVLAPPAVLFAPGSRVVVTLVEPSRGIRLALANETHPDLQDVYSNARADASLKLAPDRLIGELLASLDRAGLAEYGEHVSALPPATRTARLLVQRDDEITFMERPDPAADADAARAFARLELVMNEYYQHVGALQAVANEKGGKLLEDQHVPGSRP